MSESRRHTFFAADLPANIGVELLALRRAAGWSQAELARRSRLPRETIGRIEKNERQPRADTVLRLLRTLLAKLPDVGLQEIVPDWPEADAREVIGHAPRSRVRRQELGLSALEVAAKAGVHVSTLSRFERNIGPTPSLLKAGTTEHGDLIYSLVKEELAETLRFRDLEDHEAFCDDNDWRQWPVQAR